MTDQQWQPTGENVFGTTDVVPTDPPPEWTKIGTIKGEQGDPSTVPGPPNVLTVESVTTGAPGTPAVVDVLGTSPSQRLVFVIPEGRKGEQGIPGTDGIIGVDGLSAYEIAVQSGFTGTEAEWLTSLRGPIGPDGRSAYQVAVEDAGFVGDEVAWITSLKGDTGATGDPGPLGILVEDPVNGYPTRPVPGVPMIFVGATVPPSLIDGDTFISNVTPAPTPDYMLETDFTAWTQHLDGNASTITMRTSTTSGWYAANPVLAQGEWGLDTTARIIRMGDGVTPWLSLPFRYLTEHVRDYVYTVPKTWTSIDEFNTDTLDPAWVRVDKTGGAGRATWTQEGGVLSVKNEGGDASSELHALMRPIGTPLAVGDALVTCLTLFGPYWTNYTMGGLVLADGVTSGAGTQVITLNFITTSGQTNDIRTFINYQTEQVTAGGAQTSTPQSRIFVRLALVAANTWRQDLSLDGVSWLKSATYARTITPTYVGLHSSSWSTATKSMVRYEFFRRMSGVT